eukprot:5852707-Amphidinium_carterae.1
MNVSRSLQAFDTLRCARTLDNDFTWRNVGNSTGGLPGSSLTEKQARAICHNLWQRYKSWIQRNESPLASELAEQKSDFEKGCAHGHSAEDLATCQPRCGVLLVQNLLEPHIPAHAPVLETGLVRLAYVDWKAVALGCLANRHPRQELPTGIEMCRDLASLGLTRQQHFFRWTRIERTGRLVVSKSNQALRKLLDRFQWPAVWTTRPGEPVQVQHVPALLNLVETWLLAAPLLENWEPLSKVANLLAYSVPVEPATEAKDYVHKKPRPSSAQSSKDADASSGQPAEAGVETQVEIPSGEPAAPTLIRYCNVGCVSELGSLVSIGCGGRTTRPFDILLLMNPSTTVEFHGENQCHKKTGRDEATSYWIYAWTCVLAVQQETVGLLRLPLIW